MIIDTHAHLDVEEFADDLPEVISRAREAGVEKIFIPAIDLKSMDTVMAVCRQFPDTCYPMIGLQPEEVHKDWREVLDAMHQRIMLSSNRRRKERPYLVRQSSPLVRLDLTSIGPENTNKNSWRPLRRP